MFVNWRDSNLACLLPSRVGKGQLLSETVLFVQALNHYLPKPPGAMVGVGSSPGRALAMRGAFLAMAAVPQPRGPGRAL